MLEHAPFPGSWPGDRPPCALGGRELWKCRACGRRGKQKTAFHSFHEPLGNLAKRRRDSHIPTAPPTKPDGKVENKTRFPTFPPPPFSCSKHQSRRRVSLPAAAPPCPLVVPFYSAALGNFCSALDTLNQSFQRKRSKIKPIGQLCRRSTQNPKIGCFRCRRSCRIRCDLAWKVAL